VKNVLGVGGWLRECPVEVMFVSLVTTACMLHTRVNRKFGENKTHDANRQKRYFVLKCITKQEI